MSTTEISESGCSSLVNASFSILSTEILENILDFLDVGLFEDGFPIYPGCEPLVMKYHPQDQEKHEPVNLDNSRRLGPYATVSRKWKELVERRTFALLILSEARLKNALKILTSTRLEYVKAIDIRVTVCQVQILTRIADCTGIIAYQLKHAFETLNLLKPRLATTSHSLREATLRILVYEPIIFDRNMDQGVWTEDLPKLGFVKQLVLGGETEVHDIYVSPIAKRGPTPISPDLLKKLHDALPGIQRLVLYPFYYERGVDAIESFKWRCCRTNAIALYNSTPIGLKAISTEYYDSFANQLTGRNLDNHKYASFTGPRGGNLPAGLTAALRVASSRVNSFHFRGCMDRTFLCPADEEMEKISRPLWPHLDRMHLVISPLVGPHQWLYKVADQAWSQNLHDNNKREPGSIRNLNEIFWLRVCEVAMNDFLDVIVRGIREMPRLTHFRLEIYHSEFIIHRFDLRITDQRAHATWSSHPPPPFRPSEAVLASFNSLMHDRGLLFEFECIALPFPMYKFTGNPLLDYIEYF